MGCSGPLRLEKDFFGADEALTNYQNKDGNWVATLIMQGNSKEDIAAKKEDAMNHIKHQFGITQVLDTDPPGFNQEQR